MRFSRALIPTVKEVPADAQSVSHALLTRGGFVRRLGAGIYEYLPLGLRVLRKVERIVREEMDRAGALELLLPALLPAELFRESGRFERMGEILFRFKDRKGAECHLGPTHEEIITDLVRREIRSYRDLPRTLYQIQTKFRDEPRPRGGLLRGREFLMKDAYSFDVDEAAARTSYERMRMAYERIFDRLGLTVRMVAADSGAMGGSTSAEFQVLAQSGEDAIVVCPSCAYAANVEAAVAAPSVGAAEVPRDALSKVHTPAQRTIAEVAAFLAVPARSLLKSLLYRAKDGRHDTELVLCVVRGDHELNEAKLARLLRASEVVAASDAEIVQATGAAAGSIGPVGYRGRVLVDRDASLVANAVAGANETDHHATGVQFNRDYTGEVVDIRQVTAGDTCPECRTGVLEQYRGIEGGHIFLLGTHYSEKMGALYLGQDGMKRPIVMGCYGIGISRLMAAAVEQHHDQDGIIWPRAIAPYDVAIVSLGSEESVVQAAEALEQALAARGIETLWDDRDERAGVKFKDADLIGVPLRVIIGAKGLAKGSVELKIRGAAAAESVAVPEAPARVAALVQAP